MNGKLLSSFILRPLRADPARTALTAFAVALGVGVVVAIDLAGAAAAGSFQSSLETLLGRTDFEITANGGVNEAWIGRLASLDRNARYAPIIESQIVIDGVGTVALYGVDLLAQDKLSFQGPAAPADPDQAAVVSSALAARVGLAEGSRIGAFEVAAVVPAKDAEFLLLDVAAAQKALGIYGRLDRIDVTLSPGESEEKVEREMRALLPPSYTIAKAGTRGEETRKMLRAFRWNLRVLSFISLVVGAFLIYNTISVSVVRRRPEIGVLRALGAGRRSVLWLFLSEALIFGLVGSTAGLGLGRVLAEGVTGLIALSVNALYTSSRPAAIGLGWETAAMGLFAGTLVSLLSALAPAREAMRVEPVEAMGRGAHEHAARIRWRRDLAWGGVLAAAAVSCSFAGPVDGKPFFGYLAALLSIGAAAMCAPALVLAVTGLSGAAVRRFLGAEGMLASRSLAASLSRTSVVVGALATGIAMMASVGIMVGSFRETVLVWLDSQLRADLYIRPAGRSGAGQFPPLAPALPGLVAQVDGVEAVDVFHGLEIRYRGERATLGAGEAEIVRRLGRLRFLDGDRDAILRSLQGADRALVSEPFSNRHHVRVGDSITIPLGDREASFTVAGIYYEYSSERGFVILDRATLLKYLPDQPSTNLAVYLRPGADPATVSAGIQTVAADQMVAIARNASLRRDAVVIFDRTFAITYALEAVAILIAILGAANSLLALVLDRRRELGLLRFLGASPRQIMRMIVLEAGFLGVLANLLGAGLGFALSFLLIYVVNKQSFGWTIQFHPPLGLLGAALALVLCATVGAGVYPARAASRLRPIEAIREE